MNKAEIGQNIGFLVRHKNPSSICTYRGKMVALSIAPNRQAQQKNLGCYLMTLLLQNHVYINMCKVEKKCARVKKIVKQITLLVCGTIIIIICPAFFLS